MDVRRLRLDEEDGHGRYGRDGCDETGRQQGL
jgi:hypothetical protein